MHDGAYCYEDVVSQVHQTDCIFDSDYLRWHSILLCSKQGRKAGDGIGGMQEKVRPPSRSHGRAARVTQCITDRKAESSTICEVRLSLRHGKKAPVSD